MSLSALAGNTDERAADPRRGNHRLDRGDLPRPRGRADRSTDRTHGLAEVLDIAGLQQSCGHQAGDPLAPQKVGQDLPFSDPVVSALGRPGGDPKFPTLQRCAVTATWDAKIASVHEEARKELRSVVASLDAEVASLQEEFSAVVRDIQRFRSIEKALDAERGPDMT